MINLKLTVISAVVGLVLSLLIGMVSHVPFGYMMIRAFISAVLTGGIAAAASFVFRKFLADESATMEGMQTSSSTGNVVDITLKVDEDVLPDADNSPPFYVSPEVLRVQKPVDVYRMAAKQNVSSDTSSVSETVPETGNEKAGFVPQSLVSDKTPQFSIVPDAGIIKSPVSETADAGYSDISGQSSSVDDLDELPDLTDVGAIESDSVTDVISDSDFATAENPSASFSVGTGKQEVDVGNDATLMANTIRTLLKSEG